MVTDCAVPPVPILIAPVSSQELATIVGVVPPPAVIVGPVEQVYSLCPLPNWNEMIPVPVEITLTVPFALVVRKVCEALLVVKMFDVTELVAEILPVTVIPVVNCHVSLVSTVTHTSVEVGDASKHMDSALPN